MDNSFSNENVNQNSDFSHTGFTAGDFLDDEIRKSESHRAERDAREFKPVDTGPMTDQDMRCLSILADKLKLYGRVSVEDFNWLKHRSAGTLEVLETAMLSKKFARPGDPDKGQDQPSADKQAPFSPQSGNVMIADLLKLRDVPMMFGDEIPEDLLEICGIKDGGAVEYRHTATCLIVAIVQAALPAGRYWVGRRPLEWAGPRNTAALGRKIAKHKDIYLTGASAAVLVDLAMKIIDRSYCAASPRWIGGLRGLTAELRKEHKAYSMPPIDMSDADMEKASRAKRNDGRADRRRKKGAKSLAEYLDARAKEKAGKDAIAASRVGKKASERTKRWRRAKVMANPEIETWDDHRRQKFVSEQERRHERRVAEEAERKAAEAEAAAAGPRKPTVKRYFRQDGTEVSKATWHRDQSKSAAAADETSRQLAKCPGSVGSPSDETKPQIEKLPHRAPSPSDETMRQEKKLPFAAPRPLPVVIHTGSKKDVPSRSLVADNEVSSGAKTVGHGKDGVAAPSAPNAIAVVEAQAIHVTPCSPAAPSAAVIAGNDNVPTGAKVVVVTSDEWKPMKGDRAWVDENWEAIKAVANGRAV